MDLHSLVLARVLLGQCRMKPIIILAHPGIPTEQGFCEAHYVETLWYPLTDLCTECPTVPPALLFDLYKATDAFSVFRVEPYLSPLSRLF